MKARGFTLIELIVVMAVLGTLLMLVAPRYFTHLEHARHTVLKTNLGEVRASIDKFHADRGTYPDSLQDLVDMKYLRALPVDPVTDSAETWVLVPPEEGNLGAVYDVRSGAAGEDSQGVPLAQY